jgi:hypothetical protein
MAAAGTSRSVIINNGDEANIIHVRVMVSKPNPSLILPGPVAEVRADRDPSAAFL